VELVRFPSYKSRGGERDGLTGGKTAVAEKVRFVVIPESASAKAALYSGAIDVRPDFASRDLEEVKARRDIKIGTSPTMELNGILFQVKDPLLQDVRIRRAISMAINRDELIDAITFGLVKPVQSPVPLASPYSGATQKAEWKQDVAGARKLLAEAGYKGQPIKMIVTKRYMSLYDGAVFVQAMAKEAGINIELEVLEWASQLDLYGKGDYQSMFFTSRHGSIRRSASRCSRGPRPPSRARFGTMTGARDLITRAMVVSEPQKRQELFDDLQRKFVEDLPMIPLWNSVDIAAWRSNVMGYETWPPSMPRLWNVSFN
jgi:peptide/nickel transport system substrate-binding protein